MLTRIAALIVKELLAVWRDPKGRIVLIAPPLLQLLVFSYAATLEVRNVDIAVLNQDGGRWGVELVRRLEGSPTFRHVRHLAGEAEIRPLIDAQAVLAVVRIAPDLSRRIEAERPATVQVLLDGRRSNAAQILQGYLMRIVEGLAAELEDARGRSAGTVLVAHNWFNANLIYLWFTVPSLVGVIALVGGMTVTALSVARERELGTFDQLLVSPLVPWQILLGKTVPSLLIGLAQATLFVVVAIFVFRVPFRGSLLLLYMSLFFYLVAVIGIGLFISSLARTQQQAILGAFVFMAPAVVLSGFATPVENMPDWLQAITYVNPLRHFLIVVKGVFLKGMPAADVLANTLPLVGIALVTLAVATWLFRRRMG